MTDFADDASATEEADRARCIDMARRAPALVNESHTPGECANGCGEPTRERSIWCGKECRDDHERRARQMKRSGGA